MKAIGHIGGGVEIVPECLDEQFMLALFVSQLKGKRFGGRIRLPSGGVELSLSTFEDKRGKGVVGSDGDRSI